MAYGMGRGNGKTTPEGHLLIMVALDDGVTDFYVPMN
jgi:hypothetical protein